ncbi:MAG: putative lipid II flippase FtsW [Candidatus Omnitrophica bacterium]|nr:putative lipid II flippase FtsW [Candidatus Omnitrophota bacterium]
MRDIRISIATIVLLLIFLGVAMIYSSSGVYAMQELGDSLYFLKRHLLFLAVGFMGMFAAMAIDYRQLQKYAKPLLFIGIVMLVLVLIPGIGKASFGARRWFKFGVFSFQPSEYCKLVMLVYTADFLARKQNRIRSFRAGFMPLMLVLGVVSLLVLKQPDLGSTLLLGASVLTVMFIAGARVRHIGMLGILAVPAFYFLVVKVAYRWRRIAVFLDPWEDPQGAGFQLTQSQIALGSGGLFGVGLGKSMQKLFYLPAAHTDFILSIIGEEMGFVGAFAVIALFIAFIWQGARIAKRTLDPFGYFLSVGIVAMIGLQAMVNIGVSIGALPTKGLPLPFISYGGSALVFNMLAVGLLLNISRTEEI